jgi:Dolichyl-phosphate-mannose-protein mannosyltransferase
MVDTDYLIESDDRSPLVVRRRIGVLARPHRLRVGRAGSTGPTGGPFSWPAVPVTGLTLLALGLRLMVPRGLWSDEAISVGEARMGFGAMVQYLRTEDVHPPLYFAVLWLDVRLFGFGELAVRVPSIIAGTLIVPMAYLTGKACLNRRAGYIAAVLATVAPLMVWYSQEARMYAFYMLFALSAIWAQVRCLQDGRWRYWAAFALSSAALFYNEYFGLMQVVAQVSAFVVFLWFRRRTPEGRRRLKRALVTAGCLVLLFAPLVPYAYQQYSHSAGHPLNGVAPTGGGGSSLSVYNFLALFNWAIFGYHSNAIMADLNALWPAIMLLVLLTLGRGFDSATALVAWCIAVPFALLFAAGLYQRNLFDIRYIGGVVPLIVVLTAILVARTARRRATAAAVTALLVLVSVIGLVDQQYDWSNPRLFDFQHTVAWVAHRYRPGDVVAYGPDGIGGVIDYYAGSMPTELATPGSGQRARHLFLLIAPPLYGTDTTAEAVTIYDAEQGRKLIGRYDGANVDVWEFQ